MKKVQLCKLMDVFAKSDLLMHWWSGIRDDDDNDGGDDER